MAHEVVRIVELDEIRVRDDAPLRFRIEILRDLATPSCYRARLLRWEMFRLHPFPGGREADYSLLVEDDFWDWRSRSERTSEAAFEALLSRLREQLPGAIP